METTIEQATKRIGEVRHGHAGVSATGHQTGTYSTWSMMIPPAETPDAWTGVVSARGAPGREAVARILHGTALGQVGMVAGW